MTAAATKVIALLRANELPTAVTSLSRVTDTLLLSQALLRQRWCTASSREMGGSDIFSDLKPQERRYLVRRVKFSHYSTCVKLGPAEAVTMVH